MADATRGERRTDQLFPPAPEWPSWLPRIPGLTVARLDNDLESAYGARVRYRGNKFAVGTLASGRCFADEDTGVLRSTVLSAQLSDRLNEELGYAPESSRVGEVPGILALEEEWNRAGGYRANSKLPPLSVFVHQRLTALLSERDAALAQMTANRDAACEAQVEACSERDSLKEEVARVEFDRDATRQRIAELEGEK